MKYYLKLGYDTWTHIFDNIVPIQIRNEINMCVNAYSLGASGGEPS